MTVGNQTGVTTPIARFTDNAAESDSELLAASLLVAGSVARQRGWDVAAQGKGDARIQGNLQQLRKTQHSRRYRAWVKPGPAAADSELDQ